MKIRNGFVSNSSSSSFVIALDIDPMTMNVEEMSKLLFGEQEIIAKYDYGFHALQLAETVLKDIQYSHSNKEEPDEWSVKVNSFEGKMSKEDINKSISSGYFAGIPERDWRKETPADKIEKEAKDKGIKDPYKDPEWSKLIRDAREKEYAKEKEEIDKAAAILAEPFWKANKDKYLYVVNYSDNEGSMGCVLEHGPTFDRIPHIRISHH